MKMKKFVADTYTEALLKAQEEFGEDVLIVTTRTFPKKTWGGIFTQEMIEVTAAAPRHDFDENPGFVPPSRPLPTEEILEPARMSDRTRGRAITPAPQGIRKTSLTATGKGYAGMYPSPPPPIPQAVAETYAKVRKPVSHAESGLRAPHALRTNQEGNSEPHSQRSVEDMQKSEKMQTLLGKILDQKSKEIFGDQPLPLDPHPASFGSGTPASLARLHEASPPMSIQAIEKKISELVHMLQDLRSQSTNTLANSGPPLSEGIRGLYDRLKRLDLPGEVLDELIDHLRDEIPFQAQRSFAVIREEATAWFRRSLRFSSEPSFHPADGPTIIILLGPTGVGKTTTIAKLAASYALNVVERRSVALFTLDTFRIGAPTQLSQYAQIIEAGMEIIYEPSDIPEALGRHSQKDLILVDTAGRCQKNESELKGLKEYLDGFPNARRYLVLSATTKYHDMLDSVSRFGEICFEDIIFTKIDETNSIGPLLALLYKTKLPLAYLTHGQSVPDDFRRGSLDFFLSHLFRDE